MGQALGVQRPRTNRPVSDALKRSQEQEFLNQLLEDIRTNQPVSDAPKRSQDVLNQLLEQIEHLDLTRKLSTEDQRVHTALGGYGDVYTAYLWIGSKKIKVALKQIRVFLYKEPGLAKFLAKEMRLWSKLHHPNILEFLGYILEENGIPSLISEWMENGTALTFVKAHPETDILRLILGIAQGLEYLHEQDVVHSDLKSDNVLISEAGIPLICDFGTSRMLAATQTLGGETTSGRLQGSIRWLAAELFSGGQSVHTKQTDVWAFGMTAYELLVKDRPYYHLRYDYDIIVVIMRGEKPRQPEGLLAASDAMRDIWYICNNCWTSEVESRWSISNVAAFLISKADALRVIPQREEKSVRSNRDPAEVIRRQSPSPLLEPDSMEYYAEAAVKLGTSPSSGLVIQSPDGQPAGIFFLPRRTGQSPHHAEAGTNLHHITGDLSESDEASSDEMPALNQQIAPLDETISGMKIASTTPTPPVPISTNVDESAPTPIPESLAETKESSSSPVSPGSARAAVSPGASSYSRRSNTRRGAQESSRPPSTKKGKLGADSNSIPPISVLIAEKNPINQAILSTFMKKKKIKYAVAKNGAEAVQKWNDGSFQLILMDIQMPVMDGIEATKEIRRLERQTHSVNLSPTPPEGQQTPSEARPTDAKSNASNQTPFRPSVIIVAMTASALQSDRVAALAAGCNDFLTKPVSLEWLNNKIIEWGSIKALQMWADPRPEVVQNISHGQLNQARSVASKLHVPENRKVDRSSTPPTPKREGPAPSQIDAIRMLANMPTPSREPEADPMTPATRLHGPALEMVGSTEAQPDPLSNTGSGSSFESSSD